MSNPGSTDGVLQGRLLVADPRFTDPNFERTVVLLLAHGSGGAVGVVLNRPGGVEVRDALVEWEHLAAAPAVVFQGGPVEPGGVICLALRRRKGADGGRVPDGRRVADGESSPPEAPRGWQVVLGPLGVFHLDDDPPHLGR